MKKAGRKKVILVAAMCFVGCFLLCGGAFGNAIGDLRPDFPDYAHELTLQAVRSQILGYAGIGSLVLGSYLLASLNLGQPNTTVWLLRMAGVLPLAAGIAMVVAGIQRAIEHNDEAALSFLVAIALLAVAALCILTRTDEFVHEPTTAEQDDRQEEP